MMKSVFNRTLLLIICTLGLIGITPNRMHALNAGDIAIIRVNTDNPDAFAFVVLEEIPANEVIYFTDRAWQEIGDKFRLGEGTLTYTAPATGLSVGTVVSIQKKTGGWNTSEGSSTDDGGFFLSSFGDQLLAYQGLETAPTFLYAVQTNSTSWQSGAVDDANQSSLPEGLVEGMTAVALGQSSADEDAFANVNYDLSSINGTKAEVLAAISNYNNWQKNNGSRFISTIPDFSVTPLPVELLVFAANLQGREVGLTWSTATELNNASFTIERSIDGLAFEPLKQMNGAGTTTAVQTYHATDYLPSSNVNYYRLKQTDFDGTYTYSHVIKVDLTSVSNSLTIEQFIVNDGLINMTLRNAQTSRISYQLYNISGTLIHSQNLTDTNDIETIEIPMSSQAHGAYFLKVSNGNGKPLMKKFIY